MEAGNTAPVYVPAHTVIGAETMMGLVFAHMFMDARQATLDAQAHARIVNNQSALLANRANKNSETIDHLADLAAVAAGDTAQTENQAAVDPERTGTGDDIANDKASTLAATDVAKIAGSVAAAGQAVNADAVNSNNLTLQAQALGLINGLAAQYGLKVQVVNPTPAGA